MKRFFSLVFFCFLTVLAISCHRDSPFCHNDYCGCGNTPECPMDCGDEDGCFMDCGSANICETWCDDSCLVECVDATTCWHHCDRNCRLDCHSVGSCRATVGDGSVASCSNFGSCDIECTGSCKVNCFGCNITCPGGVSPQSCPSGNAYVCGNGDCAWN